MATPKKSAPKKPAAKKPANTRATAAKKSSKTTKPKKLDEPAPKRAEGSERLAVGRPTGDKDQTVELDFSKGWPEIPKNEGQKERKARLKAELLCYLEQTGNSMRSFCRERPEGPATSTVLAWLQEDAEFSTQYARAHEAGADVQFDVLDEIGEQASRSIIPAHVQGLRLKADIIKWKLAKKAPKKYGEKLELTGELHTKAKPDAELAAELVKMGFLVKGFTDAGNP